MAEEKNLLDEVQEAPAVFKVFTGWRVGHLKEVTIAKSGLLVPAGSEKTSEALNLIDDDTGQQFWAVASGAWKFIWPPTGKVVQTVRESQIIAEEELSKSSENGQLPIMKYLNKRNNTNQSERRLLTVSDRDIFVTTQKAI